MDPVAKFTQQNIVMVIVKKLIGQMCENTFSYYMTVYLHASTIGYLTRLHIYMLILLVIWPFHANIMVIHIFSCKCGNMPIFILT